MSVHKDVKANAKQLEVLFWSIALPGFGQLLNRKYLKGLLFVALEFIVNVKGKINAIIMYSFLGEMDKAVASADYLWVMFYPCLYLFAIWDAYRDAGEQVQPFTFLPFVFAAYLGTIGVIYSPILTIQGLLIGPVFLPIIGMISGVFVGLLLKKILRTYR